ncbi:unnamed protein product [Musa hybrid cultivar]
MAKISCFSFLFATKKKSKESFKVAKNLNGNGDLRVNPEEFDDRSIENAVTEVTLGESFAKNAKVAVDDKSVLTEASYEGSDEHDEDLSMKRDFSDFDLQALAVEKDDIVSKGWDQELINDGLEDKLEKFDVITPEVSIHNGHVSDPGMGQKSMFWGSPVLKRSCSNIETMRVGKLTRSPTKSNSSDEVYNTWGNLGGEATEDIPGSPLSVMTSVSADKALLNKRSSCQVLPSRSTKLWWKLFLFSHRNCHKPWVSVSQKIAIDDTSKNNVGYCSDTLKPNPCFETKNESDMERPEIRSNADLWPQNQWIAFSAESSLLDRVTAWVHSLEGGPFCPTDNGEAAEEVVSYATCHEAGETSGTKQSHNVRHAVGKVIQTNNIIQSLCSFSPVAHIAGLGLRVIPAISAFNSLRSVNLSGNSIVHISSGSLPKNLHTLDLSKNKIAIIEGLRELMRLRVLNLSYNRISRIGHGLSNCTLIKELYVAGNRISYVEGLHRLLKLTVLDLSFNKIITTKALGQLVANYKSLLALNLLGNPIQSNNGEEQLRKAISSFLPQLIYLNKQSIKSQRGREAATDSVAKAALGNNGWSSRRKLTRRASQLPISSARSRTGEGSSHRGVGSGGSEQKRSRQRSKSRQHSISTKK